jgi:hypothetical protein
MRSRKPTKVRICRRGSSGRRSRSNLAELPAAMPDQLPMINTGRDPFFSIEAFLLVLENVIHDIPETGEIYRCMSLQSF